MGSPCKRGHGGKIEGCPPVDNDHQVNNDHPVNNDHLVDNDHNDHTVDNDPQRSSDKTNATVNILLTRFLSSLCNLENVDVFLHTAIFGVLYI